MAHAPPLVLFNRGPRLDLVQYLPYPSQKSFAKPREVGKRFAEKHSSVLALQKTLYTHTTHKRPKLPTILRRPPELKWLRLKISARTDLLVCEEPLAPVYSRCVALQMMSVRPLMLVLMEVVTLE